MMKKPCGALAQKYSCRLSDKTLPHSTSNHCDTRKADCANALTKPIIRTSDLSRYTGSFYPPTLRLLFINQRDTARHKYDQSPGLRGRMFFLPARARTRAPNFNLGSYRRSFVVYRLFKV